MESTQKNRNVGAGLLLLFLGIAVEMSVGMYAFETSKIGGNVFEVNVGVFLCVLFVLFLNVWAVKRLSVAGCVALLISYIGALVIVTYNVMRVGVDTTALKKIAGI